MFKNLVIDEKLYYEAKSILDEVGIDVNTVVRMTLKKVVRDGNISFLTNQSEGTQNIMPVQKNIAVGDNRITKNQAISLFAAKGFRVSRNVTFASKNRSAYNYWANPSYMALREDWFLILNDWINRELHLFCVPAYEIRANELLCRIDQQDKIDLQISYNDSTFTDNRSKISFLKYFVTTIKYQ